MTYYLSYSRVVALYCELEVITPIDIEGWMCQKAYGRLDPSPTDKPQFARSQSLRYYKKALSCFMPDKDKHWDPISGTGNPTKSKPVNKLIKWIQRQEPKTTAHNSKPTAEEIISTKAANSNPNNDGNNKDYAELSNQMDLLQHQNEMLKKQVESLTATVHSLVRTNRNVSPPNNNENPIAVNPLDVPEVPVAPSGPATATATATTNGRDAAIPFEATLSPNPRTLSLLWQEYQFGIGGRRPARSFTAKERGRVKHMYHRRKVVWDVLDTLVRGAGMTAPHAIEKIYSVYGVNQSNLLSLMNRMRVDRKRGGHPELRGVEENNTRFPMTTTTTRTENPPPSVVEEQPLEVPFVALAQEEPLEVPFVALAQGPRTTNQKGIPNETTLSPNPRALAMLFQQEYQLWQQKEYQFWTGGRKPAPT
jgi:hypothetical protein